MGGKWQEHLKEVAPTLTPLDRTKFPLTLADGLRGTFADTVSKPLPGRMALVRCLNADGNELPEGEPGHGASTTELPGWPG
jgi:hypothetical protein